MQVVNKFSQRQLLLVECGRCHRLSCQRGESQQEGVRYATFGFQRSGCRLPLLLLMLLFLLLKVESFLLVNCCVHCLVRRVQRLRLPVQDGVCELRRQRDRGRHRARQWSARTHRQRIVRSLSWHDERSTRPGEDHDALLTVKWGG